MSRSVSLLLGLPDYVRVRDCRGKLATRFDSFPYPDRSLDGIVGIVAHATDSDMSAESLALYQTGKIEGDPYPAIAYHFVIRADGSVEWCHDLEVLTWHAGRRASATHVSVCFPGAGADAPATDAQVASGRALRVWLERILERPLPFVPHCEILPVALYCPGSTWPQWGEALNRDEDEAPQAPAAELSHA